MKALVFSDIHGDVRALDRLIAIEADYYFAAGDLATWEKGLDKCGVVLKIKADQVYVIPGNHESADQIASFCAKFGFHNLHGKTMKIGDWNIGGLGYSGPTPFNTPGEYTESELAAHLSQFDNLSPLIMICHAPPFGTDLDRVRDGLHAGSKSIRDFIDRSHPRYFFCGHIHEAEGVEVQLGGTTAVNVGKRGYLLNL
jgi:uncharacterized protein